MLAEILNTKFGNLWQLHNINDIINKILSKSDNNEINLNLLISPPNINITSNKILKDNILIVISQLKPFSEINSWSAKYSIYDSILNIFNMINTYGEIKHEYANEFDNETIKIQRDLGLSKDAAFEMNMELEHTAQHIGRTHKDAVQANADMNAFLGNNVMLSEKQLEDQISLTKNAGLEADVREGIYKFSQLTGKTQEEVFNSIGKQNKGVLSNKK